VQRSPPRTHLQQLAGTSDAERAPRSRALSAAARSSGEGRGGGAGPRPAAPELNLACRSCAHRSLCQGRHAAGPARPTGRVGTPGTQRSLGDPLPGYVRPRGNPAWRGAMYPRNRPSAPACRLDFTRPAGHLRARRPPASLVALIYQPPPLPGERNPCLRVRMCGLASLTRRRAWRARCLREHLRPSALLMSPSSTPLRNFVAPGGGLLLLVPPQNRLWGGQKPPATPGTALSTVHSPWFSKRSEISVERSPLSN
jgi:hypothetical protein